MQTLTPATITAPHDGTGHVDTDPAAGHTPGPWSLDSDLADDRVSVFGASDASGDQTLIAAVWAGFDKNESSANAALIARAPEMAAEIARLELGLDAARSSAKTWLKAARKAEAEIAHLTAANAKLVAALTNLMDAIVDEPFSGQRTSQGLAWRDATAVLAAAKEG